jgi:hypothetical protein
MQPQWLCCSAFLRNKVFPGTFCRYHGWIKINCGYQGTWPYGNERILKSNEEALYRPLWWTRFGRGYGPVVSKITSLSSSWTCCLYVIGVEELRLYDKKYRSGRIMDKVIILSDNYELPLMLRRLSYYLNSLTRQTTRGTGPTGSNTKTVARSNDAATSEDNRQVFLGFPVSTSECWDGSPVPKSLLHASHVALQT